VSSRDDVIEALGIRPLGQEPVSGRQPTIRLDYTGIKEPPSGGISRSKVVQSGNLFEVYDFQIPIVYGQKNKRVTPRSAPERYEEHRARSIIRAVNTVRRLIHLNFSEKDMFLTLTFNNEQPFDINSLKSCLPYFKKFVRKTRNKYPDFRYIAVPEFQKRGAVHYHLLCNLSSLSENERDELWPYGFSKPKKINGTLHLALYLCKYLSKRFEDKRKEGHRLFYTSRGLKRPQVVYGMLAERLSKKLKEERSDNIQYESQYNSVRNGNTSYTQYLRQK